MQPPCLLPSWLCGPAQAIVWAKLCKLVNVISTNGWHSFSQNSQKWWPSIWFDGFYYHAVLRLDNFYCLKREPRHWGRQWDAWCKASTEMKDFLLCRKCCRKQFSVSSPLRSWTEVSGPRPHLVSGETHP